MTSPDGTRSRQGLLDSRWAAWFDGLSLTRSMAPQSTRPLHGLLQKLRDVGLPLVSVTRVEPDQPEVPTTEP